MSECERYEFGDPIWVKTSGGEKEGFYGETAGTAGTHWCVRRCDTGLVNGSWFKDDDIRPRPVAEPARTGWRLPEPGADILATKQDIVEAAWLEAIAATLEQDGRDTLALVARELKRQRLEL